MIITDRKKEIIDKCLSTFMKDGLSETSMRDLGKALSLDPTALYAHFKSKDDVVIACAQRASMIIETELVGSALYDLNDPPRLVRNLHDKAINMRPLMGFFVTVCTMQKYKTRMEPVLLNLSERYRHYTEKFAQKLKCEPEEIAPYVYIVIDTMLSFMIFGQDNFEAPQIGIAYSALVDLLKRRDNS